MSQIGNWHRVIILQMAPIIAFLVAFGMVGANPIPRDSGICETDDWLSVLMTWAGCLIGEELVPADFTSEHLDRYCEKERELTECMYNMVAGCPNSEVIGEAVDDMFRMCRHSWLKQYLKLENLTDVVNCASDFFTTNVSACLNFTGEGVLGDSPMPYEQGVEYLKTTVVDRMPLCLKPLMSIQSMEDCGGISGPRSYLGIVAALAMEPLIGLDFYGIFQDTFEMMINNPI